MIWVLQRKRKKYVESQYLLWAIILGGLSAASIDGIGEVEVYLVWEPIWDMENISEDTKLALGLF